MSVWGNTMSQTELDNSQVETETETEAAALKSPSPALIVFLLIPLIGIAIAIGVWLADANLRNEGEANSNGLALAPTQQLPSLNYPAENFTVQTLDGMTVSLSDYSGRVVFLNFWATWCAPCVRELPAMQTFAAEQKALGDNGAVVLAINNAESPQAIQTFLTDNAISLADVPVILDEDLALYRRFVVPALPTTFVISPDGIVSYVKYGEMSLENLNFYLEQFSSQKDA